MLLEDPAQLRRASWAFAVTRRAYIGSAQWPKHSVTSFPVVMSIRGVPWRRGLLGRHRQLKRLRFYLVGNSCRNLVDHHSLHRRACIDPKHSFMLIREDTSKVCKYNIDLPEVCKLLNESLNNLLERHSNDGRPRQRFRGSVADTPEGHYFQRKASGLLRAG